MRKIYNRELLGLLNPFETLIRELMLNVSVH